MDRPADGTPFALAVKQLGLKAASDPRIHAAVRYRE